jgi:hypothetical protein
MHILPRKKIVKNKRKFETPRNISIDELAIATDEELFFLQKKLEAERQTLLSTGEDPILWETELCYIKRELQIRSIRQEAHRNFLFEEEKFLDESNLCMPDLDNLEFVKLCAQRDSLKEERKLSKNFKQMKMRKEFN